MTFGIIPKIGNPNEASISYTLLTLSSSRATANTSPKPKIIPPKNPPAKLRKTLGEEGLSSRGGNALSIIRAFAFLMFT